MLDLRLSKSDWFLILLALVGGGTFIHFFANEIDIFHLTDSGAHSNDVELGRARYIDQDVRRRAGRSMVWNPLENNDRVFDRDSIFTGPNSSAEIELDEGNGSKLQVGPNSLVVLTRQHNQLVLDLQLGQIAAQVKEGQDLKLVQNGKTAHITSKKSGTIQLIRQGKERLKVVSRTAEPKVQFHNASAQVTKKGEISLDENLQLREESFPISLELPTDGESVWVSPKAPVKFSWEADKPASNVNLQVSQDPSFKGLSLDEPQITNSFSGKAFDEGVYYWRLFDKQKKQPLSPTGQFQLITKIGPRPFYPTGGLRLDSSPRSTTLRLEWESKPEVSKYRVQLSHQPDFKTILVEQISLRPSISDVTLSAGEYFWRVKAEDTPISNLWGETANFAVGPKPPTPVPVAEVKPPPPPAVEPEAPEVELSSPQVSSPSQKTVLRFKPGTGRSPASIESAVVNPPRLTWSEVDGAKKYLVELSRQKDFSQAFMQLESEETSVLWKSPVPGNTYWRVSAVDEEGNSSPPSEAGRIETALPAPTLPITNSVLQKADSPSELEGELKSVPISWPEVPMAPNYAISITDKETKAQVVKTLSKQNNIEAKFPKVGEYQLTVNPADSKGRPMGPSAQQQIKVDRTLKIDPPLASLPQDGVQLVSFGDQPSPLIFRWKKSANAKDYEVEFASDREFQNILKKKTLNDTHFVLNEKLDGEQIYWRVRSRYESYTSDWSPVRKYEQPPPTK